MRKLFRDEIDEALSVLTTREADVLRKRYGVGVNRTMQLNEIGLIYGVSRERIRQIESEALKKLSQLPSVQALYKER